MTLKDFFAMSDAQAVNGTPSWYVGFSNCQPAILRELRKLYPIPHFLPEYVELPNSDYIFLGYEQGATMHVRHIVYLLIMLIINYFAFSWTTYQD